MFTNISPTAYKHTSKIFVFLSKDLVPITFTVTNWACNAHFVFFEQSKNIHYVPCLSMALHLNGNYSNKSSESISILQSSPNSTKAYLDILECRVVAIGNVFQRLIYLKDHVSPRHGSSSRR